jgi:hypothetical protein
VLVAELAEKVSLAIRPVQLVQVQIIGVQALEAGLQRNGDVGAVQTRVAVANMLHAAWADHFTGQHPILTITVLLEVLADNAFSLGVGFCTRWHGVHFGGVDKVDPALLGQLNLRERFFLSILLTPGHGAQRDGADVDIGFAQWSKLHR